MTKAMYVNRRYWDSDSFLGFFNEEPDKQNACEGVLAAAEDGRVIIVTSALTIAEVIWAKGHDKLDKGKRDKIASFFRQPYISVQNVTRHIAEYARDLVWDNGIKPKDAIHVSTAIVNKIPVLNTFDADLLKHDGKIGDPRLIIEIPHETYGRQTELFTKE